MGKLRIIAMLCAFGALPVQAHDTLLKFDSFFLAPESPATVFLMNGTFTQSENNVALERLQDVRITGPDRFMQRPQDAQWQLTDTLNALSFKTGTAGTYGVGLSIRPRVLEMTADSFNNYLDHSGVQDVLAARKADGTLEQPVAEKYSKHVKALFQVGDTRTANHTAVYGYPIEIVPQLNPFSLNAGDTLPVKVLFKGKPVRDQLVYAGYAGAHGASDSEQVEEPVSTRTNADGVARIELPHDGRWFVRLIHMRPSVEDGVDYESNWATLTFELRP